MEPPAPVPNLPRFGAEHAPKTQKKACLCEAGRTGCGARPPDHVVDGLRCANLRFMAHRLEDSRAARLLEQIPLNWHSHNV